MRTKPDPNDYYQAILTADPNTTYLYEIEQQRQDYYARAGGLLLDHSIAAAQHIINRFTTGPMEGVPNVGSREAARMVSNLPLMGEKRMRLLATASMHAMAFIFRLLGKDILSNKWRAENPDTTPSDLLASLVGVPYDGPVITRRLNRLAMEGDTPPPAAPRPRQPISPAGNWTEGHLARAEQFNRQGAVAGSGSGDERLSAQQELLLSALSPGSPNALPEDMILEVWGRLDGRDMSYHNVLDAIDRVARSRDMTVPELLAAHQTKAEPTSVTKGR